MNFSSKTVWVLILVGLIQLVSWRAFAHAPQFSSSELLFEKNSSRVLWNFKVNPIDFENRFKGIEEAILNQYLKNHLGIQIAGKNCTSSKPIFFEKHENPPEITFTIEWECPPLEASFKVSYDVFYGDPNHRHLFQSKLDENLIGSTTLQPSQTDAEFLIQTPQGYFFNFLKLGLEHILFGFDHLAFLGVLILTSRRLKELISLLTAFTVAHSITLALASLQIFSLTSQIVEPLIAASIIVSAISFLCFPNRVQDKKDLFLCFGFGLIHGMGLASTLQELLPKHSSVVVPLFSFNIGIELGQLCIAAVIYPFLKYLQRIQKLLLLLLATSGLYWLIQRLFF